MLLESSAGRRVSQHALNESEGSSCFSDNEGTIKDPA